MTTASQRIRVATMAGISLSLVLAGPACKAAPRSTSTAATTRPASAASEDPANEDGIYKDGVYTATGQYGNLPSFITVTVTLDDDAITVVKVTPHATDPTSLDLQRRFAAAVPAVIVGKPIDEVNVGRLAGSSGTPDGFNAAIRQIKEQARRGQTTSN